MASRRWRVAASHPVIGRILLVTDLTMPRLGGVALAAALLRQRPNLPILYMSGYGEGGLADGGVLVPSVRLLSKPFDAAALCAAVADALAGPTEPDAPARPSTWRPVATQHVARRDPARSDPARHVG